MKKSYILGAISCLSLLSGCTVNSANNLKSQEQNTLVHLVSFNTNGGDFVSSQKVNDGEFAVSPDNPSKKGFIFDGWCIDEECKTPFKFEDTKIYKDTTLYAKWSSDLFTFHVKGSNCTFLGKDENEQSVKKNKVNSTFVVIANEGCEFGDDPIKTTTTTVEYIPTVDSNKKVLTIVIERMTDDLSLEVEAETINQVTITFKGGDGCTMQNKKECTLAFHKGDINEDLFINANAGYKLPSESELGITGATQGVNYTYAFGVLHIIKLDSNMTIQPTCVLVDLFSVIGSTTAGTFTIDGKCSDVNFYKGSIGTNSFDIIFNNNDGYVLDESNINVYEGGKDKEFELTELSDSDDYKISITNINDDINFAIHPEAEYERKFNVKLNTNEDFANTKITVNSSEMKLDENGQVNFSVISSVNEQSGLFTRLEVFANDDYYRAIGELKITPEDPTNDDEIESFTFPNYDGKGSCLFYFKPTCDINIDIKSLNPRPVNDCSFKAINKACERREATSVFNLGDTKTLTLRENGTDQAFQHTIRIIGFNHDNVLNDDDDTESITFEFTNLLTKNNGKPFVSVFRKGKSDAGCYDISDLNKWFNDNYKNLLPTDLVPFVREVSKACHSSDNTTKYCDCYMYTLSVNELASGDPQGAYVYKDEEEPFEYYEHHAEEKYYVKEVVKIDGNNDNSTVESVYALRTVGSDDHLEKDEVYLVNYAGKIFADHDYSQPSDSYAIAGAFTI